MKQENNFNKFFNEYKNLNKIDNKSILLYLTEKDLYEYCEKLLFLDSTYLKKYHLSDREKLVKIWTNNIKEFSNIPFMLDIIFTQSFRRSIKKEIFINLLLNLPNIYINELIKMNYKFKLYEIQQLLKYIKENDEKSNSKRNIEMSIINYINNNKLSSKLWTVINSSVGNDKYSSSESKIFKEIDDNKKIDWINHLMYGKNLDFYFHRLFDFNINGENYIAYNELNKDFLSFFQNIVLNEVYIEKLSNSKLKKIIKYFQKLMSLFDIIELEILIKNFHRLILKRNLEKNLIFPYNNIKERVTKI